MKTLITLLLTILTLNASKAQSDNYINKHTVQIELYTKIILNDSAHLQKQIYCGLEDVYLFISKKTVLLWTDKFHLDLKVIKRKLGNSKSWLCKNATGDYYYVTPFNTGKHYGLIFQPTTVNLGVRYDLPTNIVSTGNICD